MKNFTLKFFLLIPLFFCSIISSVNGQQILYAITGASGANSILCRLDAATGSVIDTIGNTGFSNITALAISPVTGDMYGYSNPSFGIGGFIKIDPYTGKGTLIGSQSHQIADMSFNSSGILYAWSEQAPTGFDDLYTIELTTGNATKVGECDCNTTGTGLAFKPSGELFVKTGNSISKMDPNTGLILTTKALSAATSGILAFNANNEGYSGVRAGSNFILQRIDPFTGVVTSVGSNLMSLISALAFGSPLSKFTWYLDFDGDQFAVSTMESVANPGVGYTKNVLPITDCNDNDASVNPLTVWYRDADRDGFAISSIQSCISPGSDYTRSVLPLTDCNDNDATLNPLTTWYLDADGDGFAFSTLNNCNNPGSGYTRTVLPVTDCDDSKILYTDNDGDGFGAGSAIPCNGVTNKLDCDDSKILYNDVDGDGFGSGSPVACGVANNTDNCPINANPTQKDLDKDGIGDACDPAMDVCAAIENLSASVNLYVEKTKDEDKLVDRLQKALSDIIADKINQATNDLNTFINKIQAKIGKKDGLTAEQAAELIAQANMIIDALNSGAYTVPCRTGGQTDSNFETIIFEPIVSEIPLRIYPNPNTGKFFLEMKNPVNTTAQILILDAKGSVIEKRTISVTSDNQLFRFDLRNRLEGLYIIKLKSTEGVKTAKILVQK